MTTGLPSMQSTRYPSFPNTRAAANRNNRRPVTNCARRSGRAMAAARPASTGVSQSHSRESLPTAGIAVANTLNDAGSRPAVSVFNATSNGKNIVRTDPCRNPRRRPNFDTMHDRAFARRARAFVAFTTRQIDKRNQGGQLGVGARFEIPVARWSAWPPVPAQDVADPDVRFVDASLRRRLG